MIKLVMNSGKSAHRIIKKSSKDIISSLTNNEDTYGKGTLRLFITQPLIPFYIIFNLLQYYLPIINYAKILSCISSVVEKCFQYVIYVLSKIAPKKIRRKIRKFDRMLSDICMDIVWQLGSNNNQIDENKKEQNGDYSKPLHPKDPYHQAYQQGIRSRSATTKNENNKKNDQKSGNSSNDQENQLLNLAKFNFTIEYKILAATALVSIIITIFYGIIWAGVVMILGYVFSIVSTYEKVEAWIVATSEKVRAWIVATSEKVRAYLQPKIKEIAEIKTVAKEYRQDANDRLNVQRFLSNIGTKMFSGVINFGVMLQRGMRWCQGINFSKKLSELVILPFKIGVNAALWLLNLCMKPFYIGKKYAVKYTTGRK